jgi:non-specific protein-tyrosine kinase
MELRQYAAIVWKWLWLIVLGTVLAGGTAFLVSRNMTPIYRASAMLLINEASDPTLDDYSSIMASQQLIQTYAERLTKLSVLEEVMGRLDMDEWNAEVSVQPIRDTQLIWLQVDDPDPELAMQIANIIPDIFIEQNEAMHRQRFASSKANFTAQLSNLETEMGKIKQQIDRLQESDRVSDQAELQKLRDSLSEYQSSYLWVLRNYENVRLAEAQAITGLIVDQPAVLPDTPVKPRIWTNTLLAAVVGAMLAVGVAFLIEYLDDTLKSADDIRQAMGLTALGVIGRLSPDIEHNGLVTLAHPRSPISEAYRVLRTNIQFSTLDKPVKTLLVTSPNPGEGKSTTAANLGVVFAQAGHSVVLVDSDLRRPTLRRFFDVAGSLGLTTALLQSTPSTDGFLAATEVENLRVLGTGVLPANPSELLVSARMGAFVEQLKGSAEVLIFDSPPVLGVADAAILASRLDGVLLVVEAGRTRRELAQRAFESLQQVGGNVLGVVLNQLRGREAMYYYRYYEAEEPPPAEARNTLPTAQGGLLVRLSDALRRRVT